MDNDTFARTRATATKRRWLLLLTGVVIAFVLPELDPGRHLTTLLGVSDAAPAFTPVREAVWWGIALLLLLHVRFVERRPLSSIGLRRPTGRTFVIGFATALLLFASVVLIYAVVFPMLHLSMNRVATAGITRHSIGFQILLALRAAVGEEILYRGYPISRVSEATGRPWIAALVSIVVFTAAHIGYWGGAQLLIVAPAAVVLALLFLWRRDLVCNMVAHFLVDVAGFLAATAQS